MQPSHHFPQSSSLQAADIVRALARQLHRAALSDSLRVSLPVLRRILATGTLRDLTLPQLHQQRGMVRRKHLLRTLAIEAGHSGWEQYSQALAGMSVAQLPHLDVLQPAAGYPNLWFSTQEQAQIYAKSNGGRVVPVGTQAVVLMHQAAC